MSLPWTADDTLHCCEEHNTRRERWGYGTNSFEANAKLRCAWTERRAVVGAIFAYHNGRYPFFGGQDPSVGTGSAYLYDIEFESTAEAGVKITDWQAYDYKDVILSLHYSSVIRPKLYEETFEPLRENRRLPYQKFYWMDPANPTADPSADTKLTPQLTAEEHPTAQVIGATYTCTWNNWPDISAEVPAFSMVDVLNLHGCVNSQPLTYTAAALNSDSSPNNVPQSFFIRPEQALISISNIQRNDLPIRADVYWLPTAVYRASWSFIIKLNIRFGWNYKVTPPVDSSIQFETWNMFLKDGAYRKIARYENPGVQFKLFPDDSILGSPTDKRLLKFLPPTWVATGSTRSQQFADGRITTPILIE